MCCFYIVVCLRGGQLTFDRVHRGQQQQEGGGGAAECPPAPPPRTAPSSRGPRPWDSCQVGDHGRHVANAKVRVRGDAHYEVIAAQDVVQSKVHMWELWGACVQAVNLRGDFFPLMEKIS